jgi:hypothetical protein
MFRKLFENLGLVERKRRPNVVLPYDNQRRHREEVQGWLDYLGVKISQRSDPSIPVLERPNDLFDAELAASRQYSMDSRNPKRGIQGHPGLGAHNGRGRDGRTMGDFLMDGAVRSPDRD